MKRFLAGSLVGILVGFAMFYFASDDTAVVHAAFIRSFAELVALPFLSAACVTCLRTIVGQPALFDPRHTASVRIVALALGATSAGWFATLLALPLTQLAGTPDWWVPAAMHALASATALALARRLKPGHCPRCTYDLQGFMLAGCPECGWNRPPAHASHATGVAAGGFIPSSDGGGASTSGSRIDSTIVPPMAS